MQVHTPVHTFIALTGVADYWRLTNDPLARDTIIEGGELVLERGRDEGGFFFVADGQGYRESGRWPTCHSLIVLATLHDITGDRKWLEIGMHQCKLMHTLMQADTRFGPEENWAQGGIYLTWAFAFYRKAHEAGVLHDIA